MVQLKYVGPQWNGVIGLPEGWPAADHEDLDDARVAEKLASGHYAVAPPEKQSDQPSDAAAEPDGGEPRSSRKRGA